MKKIKIVSLLMLGLGAFNVLAEERLYSIELIIFSQNTPTSEVFEQMTSKIIWPNQLHFLSEYQKVDLENMALTDNFEILASSTDYTTRLHIAWMQVFQANRLSEAVKISNEEGSLDGFFRIQRSNLAYVIIDIEYSPDAAIKYPPDMTGIEYVPDTTIEYSSAMADIEYSPDAMIESLPDMTGIGQMPDGVIESLSNPVIYRLHEKRRFKLNETHYLDHPKFGILFRISRMSLEEVEKLKANMVGPILDIKKPE